MPKAHLESPTIGSVLLAGVLLKLGRAGFCRILQLVSKLDFFILVFIAILGMIIGSLLCLSQRDGKALVAFSSVAHIRFLFLCLLTLGSFSKVTSLLIIVVHGLCSSIIFLFIGYFFYFVNSRKLYFINSLLNSRSLLSFLFILIILVNFSVPPSNSFLSELLGISFLLVCLKFLTPILLFYVMYVTYFSLYLLVNTLMGKKILVVSFDQLFLRFCFIFISFSNVLLLGVI